MWLAALYFLGASMRKHGWFSGTHAGHLHLWLPAALLLTAAWRWGMRSFFNADAFPGNTEKLFYSYTSPTVLLASLCLLLLHARMDSVKAERLIEKASSSALGVFLLHTTVWNWLIVPCAGLLSPLPQSFAWLNVLLSALVITLLCIPVDLARAWVFRKLHVQELAGRIQTYFAKLCGKIAQKVERFKSRHDSAGGGVIIQRGAAAKAQPLTSANGTQLHTGICVKLAGDGFCAHSLKIEPVPEQAHAADGTQMRLPAVSACKKTEAGLVQKIIYFSHTAPSFRLHFQAASIYYS